MNTVFSPHEANAPGATANATTAATNAPVGIFDSGLGGLSVLRAIRAQLPRERLVYVADSRYAPYGERDDDFIAERTLAIGNWLVAQGAKALVIACNTATARAIALVRAHFAIPLIGVEPGIKPAALRSKTRVVGVLATHSTLRSARFLTLVERYRADCRLLCQPGHGLVEAIERGDTDSPSVVALLRDYLQPMLDANADTLVLGCTHYPFLDAAIRSIVGQRMTLIDTGTAIAGQLQRVLAQHGLQADADATDRSGETDGNTKTSTAAAPMSAAAIPTLHAAAPVRFCSTGDGAQLRTLAATLLGLDAHVECVDIPSRRATDTPLMRG